jgi:hypothetical protein
LVVAEHSVVVARSRWPSIINEKTIADFKRVADQTSILSKQPDHLPQKYGGWALTLEHFAAI